jgi:hypothetical protein
LKIGAIKMHSIKTTLQQIERFGVNAQPLELLDYLIKGSVEVAVLFGAGILVNVPSPAKFAVHKLAVSQLRQSANPE